MKIFLSHISSYKPLVREISSHLPQQLATYLVEESLTWGVGLRGLIRDAIDEDTDFVVVVFLGNESVDSEYVEQELAWALDREKQLGRMLVLPVLVDDVWDQVKPEEFQKRLYIRLNDYSANATRRAAEELSNQLVSWLAKSPISTPGRPGSRTPIMPNGQRIRQVRRDRGLSLEQVTQECGLSLGTIRRAERGEKVSLFTVQTLAEALDASLESLIATDRATPPTYQSAFISYGGPDESFARKLFEALKSHDVQVFFFPETAIPGKRLHRTMAEAVLEFDRVILVCSKNSLDRRGVLNEIEQVLTREANEGGTELIIPVAIDDYLFSDWQPENRDIATQIRARVVADFRETDDESVFEARFDRILRALEVSG